MSAEEKWLERVRALLAKAESTTFPEEREALIEKAEELMAKFAIDAAMLRAANRAKGLAGEQVILKSFKVPAKGQGSPARRYLLHVVAEAHDCRAVWWEGTERLDVAGFRCDVEQVELLWTSLDLQMVAACEHIMASNARARKRPWLDAEDRKPLGAGFRPSFYTGFVVMVRNRLFAARKRETDKVPGAAIALRDSAAVVDDWFNAHFTDLTAGRALSTGSSRDGYKRGQRAGSTADIGQSGVGGSGRREVGE